MTQENNQPQAAHNTPMEDLFDEITAALLTEQYNIDHIIEKYNVPKGNVNNFVGLIHSLRDTLTVQTPSEHFVKDLKRELLNQKNDGLFERLRYLPARVQIAAGLTLVAGFLLISRRRVLGDDLADGLDEAGDVAVAQ